MKRNGNDGDGAAKQQCHKRKFRINRIDILCRSTTYENRRKDLPARQGSLINFYGVTLELWHELLSFSGGEASN